MKYLVAMILLLLADTALAQNKILFVGDSLCFGGHLYSGVGYRQSPHEPARTLRAILGKSSGVWASAIVENFCVSSSTPTDWYDVPGSALCTDKSDEYPHLKAACQAGDGIMNHIPLDSDLIIIIDDGAIDGLTTSQVVDEFENLRDALDLITGTVLLTPPPHGPSTGNTTMPADLDRADRVAVRDEMASRVIITGPDWPDLPMSVDAVHFKDHGYVEMASMIPPFLP